MNTRLASAVRGAVVAGLAVTVAALAVWLVDIPARVHGWILGTLAVIFAISEAFFRGLISELNALYRRPGYSVWQVEQLQQVIPTVRKRVWAVWNFSLIMKAIVGICAVLLLWDGLSPKMRMIGIYGGYALLVVSLILTFWARQNFRRIELWCDEIACREVQVKEQKRMTSELNSGVPHDFEGDETLKSYSKPARPG